ncbi:MAG TPA: hypothetical protein VFR47_03010 [Anaerolineales bacterium]|nr:hypothetical protein [Anaerolineales bacterium]
MTKQLTKQTIGVGVAGTGSIGPAHIEGLRRNTIQVLGLLGSTKEKTEQKDGRAIFVIGDSTVGGVFLRNSEALIHLAQRNRFILLSKKTRPVAENRRYLPPPNAEAAGSKMQNRMREEVILKFQG